MKYRWLRLAGLCAALIMGMPTQAQGSRPAVEDFFRMPHYYAPSLSPDGRHLAVVATPQGRRTQLAVIDLQDLGQTRSLMAFSDIDIHRIRWVNNRRLVFDVAELQERSGRPVARGLWAVDVDGSNARQLINAQPDHRDWKTVAGTNSRVREQVDKLLPWTWQLLRTLRDGSDDVIVEQAQFDGTGEFTSTWAARLNTRTAAKQQVIENGPNHVQDWLFDPKGRAIAAMAIQGEGYALHLRQEAGWTRWREGNRLNAAAPQWLDVGPKGEIYLVGNGPASDADQTVLMRMDPSAPALAPQVLMAVKGYDFDGSLVFDGKTQALLGIRYNGEARDTAWLHPAMQALQQEIDKRLDGTINRVFCGDCLDGNLVVVQSGSDRQPPVYSLYRRDTKEVKTLFRSRPEIRAQDMAGREPMSIRTRDGLNMPTIVTRPKGVAASTPLPTVLLVHGGPYVRGNQWEWSEEAQFLASRGYLVIEPDFRGSVGYGSAYHRAGWKQWGLAMQDDLADAAQWAIKAGQADARRICVAGASYGGYATMMALINNPELFRCGINWVGVSDIKMLYESGSDISEIAREYDLPAMVGHPARDGERLDKTSPLQQAARLRQPLLMAYGAEDRRVPLKHGLRMRDALAGHGNKQVEWVVYPDESHGWRALETHKDFWTRVERFLDQHIGKAVP